MENGPSTRGDPGPGRVLLVEDNPGDVRLLEEAFEAATVEATLEIATDGVEAVETLSRRRNAAAARLPDLVLLDLNLPRMDGFEVLDSIRADPTLAHLPIIVLSGSDAGEDVAESYERAANAYLTKPVAHDEFVSVARAIEAFWLDRATLPPAAP